ncbi:hypothetical protein N2152v2_010335 [Parachlorella kessleri]
MQRSRGFCSVRISASNNPISGELKAGELLGNKYEVQEVLGRGANAVTYKCKEQGSGTEVAVKALSLRSLRDWKQLELFEREGQVLKGLDHPGIPRYLEYFEEESEQDKGFYLVQELANGKSLADMVASGWRADEREVARIAAGVLAILEYLGSRRPPVIHRDVKPENIVIEGGRAGGKVLLVDFGGVQGVAAAGDKLGSTIVGTYGYMAPEQFRGAAQPASDLYGLGATLLFLLSGQPPSAFPQDRLRLRFDGVAMSSRLRLLVEGLLEPLVEDRMTARQAMGVLRGDAAPAGRQYAAQRGSGRGGSVGGSRFSEEAQRRRQQQLQWLQRQQDQQLSLRGLGQYGTELYPGPYGRAVPPMAPREPRAPAGRAGPARKPAGSRVVVTQQGPRLEIEIPPAGLTGSSISIGAFALVWNAFVAFWTVSALAGGGLLFGLFSIPFWLAGGQLAKSALAGAFKRERLQVGLNSWRFQQQLALLREGGSVDWEAQEGVGRKEAKGKTQDGVGRKEAKGKTQDLDGASVEITGYVNGVPQTQLVLQEGVNRYTLGEGLQPGEQEWLADVINGHLEQNKQLGQDIEAFEPAAAALPATPPRRRSEDDGGAGAQRGQRDPRQERGRQQGGLSYLEFLGRQADAAAARAAGDARAAGERAAAAADEAGRRAREAGEDAAWMAEEAARRAAAERRRRGF